MILKKKKFFFFLIFNLIFVFIIFYIETVIENPKFKGPNPLTNPFGPSMERWGFGDEFTSISVLPYCCFNVKIKFDSGILYIKLVLKGDEKPNAFFYVYREIIDHICILCVLYILLLQ